ncbi:uncharacterized protein N7459_007012 [Penicillium hispanicum]|uniref:uncharacterized protein n=1 Tax=Penicillium hispanicum TaxID=1080232 RepID=UPI0025402314|nr:uncharacterized protein N7459_007012 [Penicillium hispanicum]KAJ5578048.1 hypothetical protein N7459_007012 [Penicillium hispanicum]
MFNLTPCAGQAPYIRLPYADFNALKLPSGKKPKADVVLLAGRLLQRRNGRSFRVGYQAIDLNGSSKKANIAPENMIRVTRACCIQRRFCEWYDEIELKHFEKVILTPDP